MFVLWSFMVVSCTLASRSALKPWIQYHLHSKFFSGLQYRWLNGYLSSITKEWEYYKRVHTLLVEVKIQFCHEISEDPVCKRKLALWKIICLNRKRINSALNIYLHLNNIWIDDFTWCITDPFGYMCLNLLIKISCCSFCWWKRYPVRIFSRDTLNAGEKVDARFQPDQSFICCFILHPETSADKN